MPNLTVNQQLTLFFCIGLLAGKFNLIGGIGILIGIIIVSLLN